MEFKVMKNIVHKYISVFQKAVYSTLVFLIALTSCDKEINSGITKEDAVPGLVSNIKVEPTPGGAILTYNLPNDENLSYVEAVVKKPEGKTVNFLSSSFRDTISVVGLGTTAEQEVLLYSVSRGGMKSEPVSVKIHPLTPPHIAVLADLTLSEGLGGVSVNYTNEGGADLAFYFGIVENGKFVEKDIKYSDVVNGRLLFWGYPPEEQEFALYVRDRWDHYSDTVYARVTPLEEVMLDKSKFKALQLQYDGTYQTDTYQRPENLWDGAWSTDYTNPFTPANWRHGAVNQQADGSPAALTIDLGEYVNISRIRINHYWKYNTNEGGHPEVDGNGKSTVW